MGVQENFTPSSKAHPAFAVAGLEELLGRLDVTRDGPRVYTEDPWGNRLELVPA